MIIWDILQGSFKLNAWDGFFPKARYSQIRQNSRAANSNIYLPCLRNTN